MIEVFIEEPIEATNNGRNTTEGIARKKFMELSRDRLIFSFNEMKIPIKSEITTPIRNPISASQRVKVRLRQKSNV